MKIKIGLLSLVFLVFGGNFAVIAGNQQGVRVNRGSSPEEIASTIADRANEDEKIQDTKMNKINNKQGGYPKQYQLTNTAEWIRKNIQPYLQWILYIGLIAATILLIWNGFRLVTNSTLGGGDIKTVKNNIKNILIGVLIMTGFLVIIKLTMAVINMFFSR
ncbi:hypothetical protein D8B45_00240 [Candidatus Gracilibacteria bacterium]|nr:MAG: hypothetical protein D8B45_00240 [Candidatus Gracilibacteria bacterium]